MSEKKYIIKYDENCVYIMDNSINFPVLTLRKDNFDDKGVTRICRLLNAFYEEKEDLEKEIEDIKGDG